MAGSSSVLGRRIAIRCVVALVCVLAVYFAFGFGVYYWKEHVHHYEAGAIASLIALHTMRENYTKGSCFIR